MRLARVADRDNTIFLARIEGDVAVPIFREDTTPGADALRSAIAAGLDLRAAPAVHDPSPVTEWSLRSPVGAPQKVLAIGRNYAEHARETGQEPPTTPIVFAKMPSSIIGPGDPIIYSKAHSQQVDYETELAVVIGRRTRMVSPDDALDYVLGYTVCNDVSARDVQFGEGQWVRGKSFDTFCPLGPWIVTTDEIPDPQVLKISARLNGQTMQDSSTAEMIFSVAALVSFLSLAITLEPGDVIATGTPPGVGFARTPPVFLLDGDTAEMEVEGIGILRNPVVVTG